MKANRAVYVGGFGNGKRLGRGVAEVLDRQYEDVESHTFSWAMINPAQMRAIMDGADVFTHSAGFMAIPDRARPRHIEAFSPPLPSKKRKLIGRTALKSYNMHAAIETFDDAQAVARYNLSSMAELAVRPIRNLAHLNAISEFDLVGVVGAMNEDGIGVSLTYPDSDEYFQPSNYTYRTLEAFDGTDIRTIPGVHDQLVLRPHATLLAANVPQRRNWQAL